MGLAMSFMGKGLPSTQMVGFVMGTLYKQFVERDIKTFEEFHIAILDIFSSFNSSLPGKHYDVPSRKNVQECFSGWKDAKSEPERKELFIAFMKKYVHLSKLDDSVMVTGVVTPPAAMVAKKAIENVPQLKLLKYVPDVVFVPAATVAALISVKLTRKMFVGGLATAE
ncbi:calcium ion binding protein, putative [Ricinus communis]|uniref:Calcium ion binding protein, putative n=1 Tax=Ricinus communis TaxID=3988 RepID=B9SG40_RICCO|nr:calcium ion binding protein, putative [Ricinus communis]